MFDLKWRNKSPCSSLAVFAWAWEGAFKRPEEVDEKTEQCHGVSRVSKARPVRLNFVCVRKMIEGWLQENSYSFNWWAHEIAFSPPFFTSGGRQSLIRFCLEDIDWQPGIAVDCGNTKKIHIVGQRSRWPLGQVYQTKKHGIFSLRRLCSELVFHCSREVCTFAEGRSWLLCRS